MKNEKISEIDLFFFIDFALNDFKKVFCFFYNITFLILKYLFDSEKLIDDKN